MNYMPKDNYTHLYQDALDGKTSKLAFFIDQYDHILMNATFKDSLAKMKREKITKMMFLLIGRRYFLLKQFDHVLSELFPAGILQYLWDSGYSDIYTRFDEEESDSRRILSLSDLEYGFVIWLALFPIPIIAFICELYSLKFKRMRRKLAGLIEFLLLLRARMSVYHG
jgi:hypothetical protein